MNTVNHTLRRFIINRPLWEILLKLQSKFNTRYGAYANLIEIAQAKDSAALDRLTDNKGQALWLAEQLIGQEEFWGTVVDCIHHGIGIDETDGDLSKSDARILHKLIRVSGLL